MGIMHLGDIPMGYMYTDDHDRFVTYDYIESTTGSEYIVLPSVIGIPKLVFEYVYYTLSNCSLFQIDGQGSPRYSYWGCNPDGSYYYNYNTPDAWATASVNDDTKDVGGSLEFSHQIVVNGVVKWETTPVDFTQHNKHVRIWGTGYNGSRGIRIGHTQLYNGDTLVHDLYPVYDKSEGEFGMYDKKTGVTLFNQGTGDFIGGTL